MLFKWLLLAFIAWYVYRAGRNLVRVALGRAEEPLTGRDPRSRFDADSGARDQRNDSVRIHVDRTTASSSRPPDSQIEDARFKDM